MKRNMGIIIILVGVGVLFISIFFSSGYSKYDILDGHRLTIMENIYQMKIILSSSKERQISHKGRLFDPIRVRVIENKIAIPLKYLLTFSVALILVGTGILLFKRKT